MILNALGIVDASPIQVSETLRSLNLSHTFVGGFGRTTHTTIDSLSVEQPAWPVIIDRVRNIPRVNVPYSRTVYFVCDARSALAVSNLSPVLWPENRGPDWDRAVRDALIEANTRESSWELSINEPTLDEYVGEAAQPTFLNSLLKLTCKITPYALRKDASRLAVAYLAGAISVTALRRAYRGNAKLSALLPVMESEDALNLRTAVSAARITNPDRAAQEFGVQSFEIRFVLRSHGLHGS